MYGADLFGIDWKGPGYGSNVNQVQPTGYCAAVMNSQDPFAGFAQLPGNFYQDYCLKANKACMVRWNPPLVSPVPNEELMIVR